MNYFIPQWEEATRRYGMGRIDPYTKKARTLIFLGTVRSTDEDRERG